MIQIDSNVLLYASVSPDALAPVSGNFVHDRRLAAIMLENGVRRIVTRDRDFRRIPGIQVIDPTL